MRIWRQDKNNRRNRFRIKSKIYFRQFFFLFLNFQTRDSEFNRFPEINSREKPANYLIKRSRDLSIQVWYTITEDSERSKKCSPLYLFIRATKIRSTRNSKDSTPTSMNKGFKLRKIRIVNNINKKPWLENS